MKNKFYTIAALLVMGIAANAQVGIGTTTPVASSMLDITSTTKGFLMPRMTTANRTAIASPARGLQVFDTTTLSVWYFDGTTWKDSKVSTNIYNANGTLTSERTVSLGGYGLHFAKGTNEVSLDIDNSIPGLTWLTARGDSRSLIRNSAGSYVLDTEILNDGTSRLLASGTTSLMVGTNANSGPLIFTAGSEAARLLPNGNLGIGTDTPTAKLEVNGTVKITDGSQAAGKVLTSDANGLASWQTASAASAADGSETKVNAGTNTTVTGSGTTASPYVLNASNLYTNNGTLTGGRTVTMGANNLQFNSTTGTFIVNTAAGSQAFTQTGAGIFGIDAPNVSNGRLVVLENGNVGIGKQTPTAKLDINGQAIQVTNSGAASFVKLTNGTNDVRLQQNNGIGFVGSLSNNDFQVYSNNLPRITALAGGNVGIGTSTPSSLLEVNGIITATKIQGPSDSRFKKNIKPIENALEKVMKLGGYTYDWKEASEFPNQTLGKGHDMGVIAQEVEKQFPEAVSTNADGFKAVSYTELVPALIEAIKTQQLQVQAQQAEINELKATVAKIKK